MAKFQWPWARKSVSTLDLFRQVFGGALTASGVSVTTEQALRVATVFGCLRVIADGISQVPLKLYRQSADGKSRLPYREHPLYNVLHRRPNAFQTSFEYRETVAMHTVLCGNHFSFKVRGLGGKLAELLPLEPGCVTVTQNADWSLSYTLRTKGGEPRPVPASDIWHVRGPSWNAWMGLDCVRMAREALGLAIATEEHHGSLHRNQSKPGGILSVEGKLSPTQYTDLRKWVTENFEGSANAYKTAIIDNGAKWLPAVMSGVDAQHLETRRMQVEEVCRYFRVMPIMIGHSDKTATFASAQSMFLAHVVHTLAPWYERIEQSIDVNLLDAKDQRDGVYAKFTEEGLLRGSLTETKDYLLGLVNGGLMTTNEGRGKLDLDPDTDPQSDKLRLPANIVGTPAPAAAAA